MQLGPRAIDLRSADMLQSWVPRPYMTSIVILSINVLLYLAMVAFSMHASPSGTGGGFSSFWRGFSGQVLLLFGGKFGPLMTSGHQWWRLVTAGFLHGGLVHIGMNMWVMFELVAEVEQFYGWSRLILVYVISTILGFFVSFLWAPMTISIGASAACFGLIGAMLAIGLRHRSDPLAQAIRHYYRRWLVYALIFSFLPGIDLAAHVGGLVGGFLAGYLSGLPGLADTPKERAVQVLAGLAVALTLYCFLQDYRFFAAMQGRLAG
jgi:rhomboid protease GluP